MLSLRIREGNAEAFTEFVAEYYERALRVAYSVVPSRDVAQDIAQDVFFHLWQRRDTLHAARLTAGYVLTAVHHRALNVLKGERVRARHREERMMADDITGASNATLEDAPLTQAIVHETLAELPERWQLAVRLRYQEQLAVPEIAATLGISSNAAHQLLHRAVRDLRRRLGAL
jgi:RNA polymerase sigma-70 factor (ECF subfamily)